MSKRVSRVCKWCGHKVTFDVEKHDKHIYNKAIDEAICKVEEHKTKGYVTGITNNPFEFGACQMADDIVKILEQLKAGGENDNLRR